MVESKIRLKKRNVVVVAIFYAILLVSVSLPRLVAPIFFVPELEEYAAAALIRPLMTTVLIYMVICLALMHLFIVSAKARETRGKAHFKRNYGLSRFGVEWASFFHVFRSKDAVAQDAVAMIGTRLNEDLSHHDLKLLELEDRDRDLVASETRVFFFTDGIHTNRGAMVYFVMHPTRLGDVQGVRWWIMTQGANDPNKLLWRYVLSFWYVPFDVFRKLRGSPSRILVSIRTLNLGFYDGLDILSFARKMEFVAFYALIETLEKYGIDTSDLKAQTGSVLNINVSGGSANFGNVVQGMFQQRGKAAGGGGRAG